MCGVAGPLQPGQDVGCLLQVAGPAQQLGLHQQQPVGEDGRRAFVSSVVAARRAVRAPSQSPASARRSVFSAAAASWTCGSGAMASTSATRAEPPVDAVGLAPVERHPGEREVGGDGLHRYGPARFGCALHGRLRLGLRGVEITALGQQQGQL